MATMPFKASIEPTRRTMMIGLVCTGAMIGVGGLTVIREILRLRQATHRSRHAQGRANLHVQKADVESLAGIDLSLAALETFFEDAKGRAGRFAKDMLGLYGKYKLLVWGRKKFVTRKFHKHFFSPEELSHAITNAVAAYGAELEAIDNKMLVSIRLDVADLSAGTTFASISVPDLQGRYHAERGRIAGIARVDAAADAGRIAADAVVPGVVAMVAARMGTSATVLGAGVASSVCTFGIGLVVSMIVDHLVSAVWSRTYNPKGRLAKMMRAKLDEVRNLILDGEADKPGLRQLLRECAEQRASVRRRVVQELLADTNGGVRP